MSLTWINILTGASAIYCWLIAGVFLAFSDFVMKSLGALVPTQGIAAMQSINILVFRSFFMVGLFAVSAASLVFFAYGILVGGTSAGFLMSAGAIYLVTVMGVSAVGNIPLNNRLAVLDPKSAEATDLWTGYLRMWVRWNHIRTVGSALAATLMTVAVFQSG